MTDLATHLAEAPEGVTAPEYDQETEEWTPWHIDHDNVATWALRKLYLLGREKARIADQAQAEMDRIAAWRDKLTVSLDRDATFFEMKLADYLLLVRERTGDPSLKTYKLPAGTISARANRGGIEVLDEEKFLEWAKEHEPELIRTKESVDKVAIKKFTVATDGVSLVGETGERIPYLEHRGGGEKITAKPADIPMVGE